MPETGTLQQPTHSESNVPVSELHEQNGHVKSEHRCSSTGARAYGPGMLLHNNPGTLVLCQTDMHLESEDESDRENFIIPPYRRTSSSGTLRTGSTGFAAKKLHYIWHDFGKYKRAIDTRL